jgi:hypothetical protein
MVRVSGKLPCEEGRLHTVSLAVLSTKRAFVWPAGCNPGPAKGADAMTTVSNAKKSPPWNVRFPGYDSGALALAHVVDGAQQELNRDLATLAGMAPDAPGREALQQKIQQRQQWIQELKDFLSELNKAAAKAEERRHGDVMAVWT